MKLYVYTDKEGAWADFVKFHGFPEDIKYEQLSPAMQARADEVIYLGHEVELEYAWKKREKKYELIRIDGKSVNSSFNV